MGMVASGSRMGDMEKALAICIDMGLVEDNGREEAGDLPALLRDFNDISRSVRGAIHIRVLRKVTESSSSFGTVGQVIDTTDYDMQQRFSQWHFEKGVSPALLVLESARYAVDGAPNHEVLPPEELSGSILGLIQKQRSLAYPIIQAFLLLQPSAALSRPGLNPDEIVEEMERAGATVQNGWTFTREPEFW